MSNSTPPIAPGPWQPTRESIARHCVPEWFEDAKFGMFIDWGLYSVPGWAPIPEKGPTYPDWYLHLMYTDPRFREYHAKTWGEQFQRDDFLYLFMAREYEPEQLAETAKRCGMKYVVPFCKHHDGFCLWPCNVTGRDSGKIGPQSDLIGPLVEACREAGLKFGFYQSLEEWEYPVLAPDGSLLLRVWDTKEDAKIVEYDPAALSGRITGKRPVRDYARDYLLPQTMEFINRYDPDLIWFDGDWTGQAETFLSFHMAAHFYNRAEGRKEVAVNDRYGKTRSQIGDFFTSEYGEVQGKPFDLARGLRHKWEECRGISQSFGYNRLDTEQNVISATQLIHMLVDIVARNGNLLLVVNLNGEGGLPAMQAARLEEVGRWLAVNGEAIYATRPWDRVAEGDSIRFTRSKDGRHLYAICLSWPGGSITLPGVRPAEGSVVTMLGVDRPLMWRAAGTGMVIDIPNELHKARPCDHAWVLRFAV